jgi:hypothetical protein
MIESISSFVNGSSRISKFLLMLIESGGQNICVKILLNPISSYRHPTTT